MNKQDIEKLWSDFIQYLKPLFSNSNVFESCIASSKVLKYADGVAKIEVATIFAKSIFANDCKDYLDDYFEKQLNKHLTFIFLLPHEKTIANLNEEIVSKPSMDLNVNNGLIKDFTLDNFIVGDFNKSAYNAVCAICKNLGANYNPLFIYGSTGLGKTHLIMALGNWFLKQHPDKKIKYIDSNEFTRDVFSAISKGSNFIEELKREYSMIDLLLIDDIQYLAGKDKTNEIFFNIFNNLVKFNKQIVITADKNPEQLDSLEERMVSRFSSGLTLKINHPEAEALKRIISQRVKQQDSNFVFQEEAINEIMLYYNNDLRKLIGILNKISFYAIQNLQPHEVITKDFIQVFLDETNNKTAGIKSFNPDLIIATVCKWYGVKVELVKGKSRLKVLTTTRHICMYILRTKYNMGLTEIGSYFSNRDHTTVMSAIDNVTKLIEKDADLKRYIEESVNKF